MNYFKVIPENFFSVLSSINKNLYLNTAKLIFDKTVEIGVLNMHKDELVDLLQDFYIESNYEYFNEDKQASSCRDSALIVLRRLKAYGWLDENVTKFNSYYSLTDIAITQLEAIEKMSNHEISYTGEIYTIYSLIANRKQGKQISYYDLMMQVSKNTATFFRSISKVNNQLKKSINAILGSNDVNEVIRLLVEYISTYHESAFAKLADVKNNVYYYRKEIIQNIETIENDVFELEEYIESIQKEKRLSKKEAEEIARNTIHSIKSTFLSYDKRHKEIQDNNNKLLRSVNMKLNFLQSNFKSTTGMINNILRNCDSDDKLMIIQNNIHLIEQWHLSPSSMYSKRKSNVFVPQKISDDKVDFSNQASAFIGRNTSKYTKKYVNKTVTSLLGKNQSIKASTVDVEDKYTLLLYILVYSTSSHQYQIKKLNDNIIFGNRVLNDFTIEVKRNA